MSNIFIVSDTHFHHANMLKFTDQYGNRVRTFDDVNHMNEHMVERWNSVVRPQDKVYHLGDVALGKDNLDILDRLNGHKRLVRGNHDIYNTGLYLKYFDEVYGSRVLDHMIFTHIPIHPESLSRFTGNVHGHIHERPEFGPRYFNASVERIDYTPISIEDIKKKFQA